MLVFEAKKVLERVEKMGDLFESVRQLKQKLPKLAGIEEGKPEPIKVGLEIAAQAAPAHKITKQRAQTVRPPTTPKKKRRKV